MSATNGRATAGEHLRTSLEPDSTGAPVGDELSHALTASVNEGVKRLRRGWPSLLATGFVGGVDVSVGVFAAFLVLANDGSELIGALAFSIGFIALTMAGSELFTENFLLPLTAVATEKGTWRQVGKLWVGTASMNLVGGLMMVVLVMIAFPEVTDVAVEKGGEFVDTGPGLQLFVSAVLAGIVITLMTWMQTGASLGPQLVAAVAAGFLLHYGGLAHAVVASLEVFGAVMGDEAYTAGQWPALFAVMVAGNMVGGIGLVTMVRLVQVGTTRVEAARRESVPAETDSPEDVEVDSDVTIPPG